MWKWILLFFFFFFFLKFVFLKFHLLNVYICMKWSEVAHSCPTLWGSLDCSLPGSSAHGIFQARVLEWVAISFSGGSSRPRDWTRVSHTIGRALPSEPGKPYICKYMVFGRKYVDCTDAIYIHTHTHTHTHTHRCNIVLVFCWYLKNYHPLCGLSSTHFPSHSFLTWKVNMVS